MFSRRIEFFALALGFTAFFPSHAATAAPPFVSGEIVIYATPDRIPGLNVKKYLPHAGISVLKVSPGQELGQIQRLRAQGKQVGLNRIATTAFRPDDPLYGYQWHLRKTQTPGAWNISDGSGVTVAVLDTGLAPDGPDGIQCVTPGYDIVSGDADPYDGNGHGTLVSGIIAQRTDNGIGVAGMAHGACIMPIKVMADSGSGTFADIAEGVFYAVDNGASVINMSLGTDAHLGITNDPIMDMALDYAYSHGVTVVAAAGNEGYRSNISYPAIYPSVIGVGATNLRNRRPAYSNKGSGLLLMAPGGDLGKDLNSDGIADGVLQETSQGGEFAYYLYEGTSMSSAQVSAAAAIVISNGAANTPDEVLALLAGTARDLGSTGFDNGYGYGLIQLRDALTTGLVPPISCIDADGDGYCVLADCDDQKAGVHPGANDTRGKGGSNGIDNDCNGVIDG